MTDVRRIANTSVELRNANAVIFSFFFFYVKFFSVVVKDQITESMWANICEILINDSRIVIKLFNIEQRKIHTCKKNRKGGNINSPKTFEEFNMFYFFIEVFYKSISANKKSSGAATAIKNRFSVFVDAKSIYNVNFICVCEVLTTIMLFLVFDKCIVYRTDDIAIEVLKLKVTNLFNISSQFGKIFSGVSEFVKRCFLKDRLIVMNKNIVKAFA